MSEIKSGDAVVIKGCQCCECEPTYPNGVNAYTVPVYPNNGPLFEVNIRRKGLQSRANFHLCAVHLAQLRDNIDEALADTATTPQLSDTRRNDIIEQLWGALRNLADECWKCNTEDTDFDEFDGRVLDAAEKVLAATTPQPTNSKPSGVDLICAERQRQIEVEGYSSKHDDNEHPDGELLRAVTAMAYETSDPQIQAVILAPHWAWALREKHELNKIRRLSIAGALIAAEIDRLHRAALQPTQEEQVQALAAQLEKALEKDPAFERTESGNWRSVELLTNDSATPQPTQEERKALALDQGRMLCSVCNKDIRTCPHVPSRQYDGVTCVVVEQPAQEGKR